MAFCKRIQFQHANFGYLKFQHSFGMSDTYRQVSYKCRCPIHIQHGHTIILRYPCFIVDACQMAWGFFTFVSLESMYDDNLFNIVLVISWYRNYTNYLGSLQIFTLTLSTFLGGVHQFVHINLFSIQVVALSIFFSYKFYVLMSGHMMN